MPYVDQAARHALDFSVRPRPGTAGELTYLLYSTVLRFTAAQGMRFETFAEAVGALEATKLEFYRRHVAPYEDRKLAENGDVA